MCKAVCFFVCLFFFYLIYYLFLLLILPNVSSVPALCLFLFCFVCFFFLNHSLFKEGNPSLEASFFSVSTIELSSPEESAKDYSRIIKKNLDGDPPRFDLILLGLGDDGHTASLFPGTDALYVRDDLITVGVGKGHHRITFTSELLNSTDNVVFLISGAPSLSR